MVGHADNVRIRYGAEQIADEVVELHVGDEVRGLLIAQRSTQHARQSEQGVTSTRQAVGLAVGTDQLTLDAECGGLQRDKINVLECRAIHSLAKHDC